MRYSNIFQQCISVIARFMRLIQCAMRDATEAKQLAVAVFMLLDLYAIKIKNMEICLFPT